MVALMPVTSVPPVFVTVSDTVYAWPTETKDGIAVTTSSTPGAPTMISGDATGPTTSAAPLLTSSALTVVENASGPVTLPVKVQVNVRVAPPARTNGVAD